MENCMADKLEQGDSILPLTLLLKLILHQGQTKTKVAPWTAHSVPPTVTLLLWSGCQRVLTEKKIQFQYFLVTNSFHSLVLPDQIWPLLLQICCDAKFWEVWQSTYSNEIWSRFHLQNLRWDKDQARSDKGIFTNCLKICPWCNMHYKSYLQVSYSIHAYSNKNLQWIPSYNNTRYFHETTVKEKPFLGTCTFLFPHCQLFLF